MGYWSSAGTGKANLNGGLPGVGMQKNAQWGKTGGSSSSSSEWYAKNKNKTNPWESALEAAYGATARAGESTGDGKYTGAWDSGVASAQALVGKDYTSDLNSLAQAEIDKEKTSQANEFGSIGMRELSFRSDVQNDWSKRRTTASTQAAIDAQEMQTNALAALTSMIEGAGSYELEQIASDLSAAEALLEAAKAGASSAQDWESLLAQYSD